jgi:[ribosomal protein S5]-alanine N-acetyltransferase
VRELAGHAGPDARGRALRTNLFRVPSEAIRPMRLRPERPWQEHASLYTDLFADPAVAAALWPGALGGTRSGTQASEILAADIRHWQEERFGPWVFFESATGLFVGRGGLRRCKVASSDCVEVMYAVRSDAWGDGYATEMATIAVAHARRLGLTEVVGFTTTTNRASRRVLEKVGISCRDVFEYAGIPHWLGRLVIVGSGQAHAG